MVPPTEPLGAVVAPDDTLVGADGVMVAGALIGTGGVIGGGVMAAGALTTTGGALAAGAGAGAGGGAGADAVAAAPAELLLLAGGGVPGQGCRVQQRCGRGLMPGLR